MEALVIKAPFQMAMEEVAKPIAGVGEVLVRVEAAGICAGDLYIYRGKNPYATYPRIGGHEIAGVVEVGAGDFSAGDRVVIEPFLPCGTCYPCRVGKGNCCVNLQIIGVQLPGGFAEWVVAPAQRLHRVPDSLSALWASFAEPIAIAVQAMRRAQLGAELCLILGCGPIGLAVLEVAKAKGATILATDPDPARLKVAEELGAKTYLTDAGLAQWVLDQTKGESAPVVFEATGVPSVMTQALDLVASGGRVVILGLVPKGGMVQFAGLDITRKEATLLGSRASTDCFPEAIALLADGVLSYPLTAQSFALSDGPSIFAQIHENPASLGKGVFVL